MFAAHFAPQRLLFDISDYGIRFPPPSAARLVMAAKLSFLLVFFVALASLGALSFLLFGRSGKRLDETIAQKKLREDVPGFRAGAVALAVDGKTSLAEDSRTGALYLVALRGDGIVTRRLTGDAIRQISRNGAVIDLRLLDFGFPKTRMTFAAEDDAHAWHSRLQRVAA